MPMNITHQDRIRGCLLGGAIGYALGAPIEFWSDEDILAEFGADGVQGYLPARFGDVAGKGLVTDDTQMTLFTVEGLLRANMRGMTRGMCHPPGVVHHAYQRWLTTQNRKGPPPPDDTSGPDGVDGWLGREAWLYSRRVPGGACLSALGASRGDGYGGAADNDSKGCGGVMRSAPFGLFGPSLQEAAALAAECAGLTHGHVTGQLASGAFAAIIWTICRGRPLELAVNAATDWLVAQPGHEETLEALQRAVRAAQTREPAHAAVVHVGEGWVAEEALAVGVYCALACPAPEQVRRALSLAVSHGGDSDSTGSICGNLLGAMHGTAALPQDLLTDLEGRETIEQLAEHMWVFLDTPERVASGEYGTSDDPEEERRWWDRYPGW